MLHERSRAAGSEHDFHSAYLGGAFVSLSRKLETIANTSTIIVSILLSVVLIKVYLGHSSTAHGAAIASANRADNIAPGKIIDGQFLGVDWKMNQRTLVMAVSTTCHFCSESAPFYRKLAAETERNVKLVAVLPQPVSEGEEYLSGEGVHVDEVKQAPLPSIGVLGTPTLLLVNNVGAVTKVWVGELQANQEAEVISALQNQNTEGRK
jgi:hypothetical protein